MKNITPHNDKDERHGYWEIYYLNTILWGKVFYINGNKNGYEECYKRPNFSSLAVPHELSELRFHL